MSCPQDTSLTKARLALAINARRAREKLPPGTTPVLSFNEAVGVPWAECMSPEFEQEVLNRSPYTTQRVSREAAEYLNQLRIAAGQRNVGKVIEALICFAEENPAAFADSLAGFVLREPVSKKAP